MELTSREVLLRQQLKSSAIRSRSLVSAYCLPLDLTPLQQTHGTSGLAVELTLGLAVELTLGLTVELTLLVLTVELTLGLSGGLTDGRTCGLAFRVVAL